MTHINRILAEFIEIMIENLKRQSFDEDGEQREETLGRVERLKNLLMDIT